MAQKFVYMASGQEVELDDPTDAYTPQQIKDHWTTTFPELSNASWEEKRAKDGTKVITFAKKVGTKGASLDLPSQIFMRALACELGTTEETLEMALTKAMATVGYRHFEVTIRPGGLVLEMGCFDWTYSGPMTQNDFSDALARLGRCQ